MKWLPTSRNSKGFTLLEMLIAIAIVAMVMLVSYQVTSRMLRTKKRIETRQELFHSARVGLEKMVQDISMAFLLKGKAHLGDDQGSDQLKTVFKGDENDLYFVSMSHLRLFSTSYESETAEVGYKIEKDPDGGDGYVLMRRESKFIDRNPEEGGRWIVIADRVKKIELEYYDDKKNEWQTSWNSETEQNDRLPEAVRIRLALQHPTREGEEIPFTTVARIGMYENPIDF